MQRSHTRLAVKLSASPVTGLLNITAASKPLPLMVAIFSGNLALWKVALLRTMRIIRKNPPKSNYVLVNSPKFAYGISEQMYIFLGAATILTS